LCGQADHPDANEPYHVSLGFVQEYDPGVESVLDLPIDWEAERECQSSDWIRGRCDLSSF
jgi:hypothetical protein